MAVIGDVSHQAIARVADRYTSYDSLRYVGDPDDQLWSSMGLIIPADILDAFVESIWIASVDATTNHEVDPLSLRECVQCYVRPAGGTHVRGIGVSLPIMGYGNKFDQAGPAGWSTEFRPAPEGMHITRDDVIVVEMPPAEDNAADTGTYDVRLNLMGVRYTKK